MKCQHSQRLLGGTIPKRVGDHVMAPSGIVAGASASRRGELVTPAGFLAQLLNDAPARARGLNPRAVARH